MNTAQQGGCSGLCFGTTFNSLNNHKLQEVISGEETINDQSIKVWGYYIHLTDVEVLLNPRCTKPHNKKLKSALEKLIVYTEPLDS